MWRQSDKIEIQLPVGPASLWQPGSLWQPLTVGSDLLADERCSPVLDYLRSTHLGERLHRWRKIGTVRMKRRRRRRTRRRWTNWKSKRNSDPRFWYRVSFVISLVQVRLLFPCVISLVLYQCALSVARGGARVLPLSLPSGRDGTQDQDKIGLNASMIEKK